MVKLRICLIYFCPRIRDRILKEAFMEVSSDLLFPILNWYKLIPNTVIHGHKVLIKAFCCSSPANSSRWNFPGNKNSDGSQGENADGSLQTGNREFWI